MPPIPLLHHRAYSYPEHTPCQEHNTGQSLNKDTYLLVAVGFIGVR
jgi:hypothetical protein